jgi:GGDEF domain-containing protein
MWSAASGATSSLPLLAQSALPSALDKAEALASAISAAPFEWEGQPIPPTIAYGVYTFKLGESVDDALAAADRAMYANKQNARGAEG